MKTTSPPIKLKNPSPAPKECDDERFYDLFKTCLHGLSSQFENQHSDGLYPDFYDGAAELERCKQIAERASTLAAFATAMFENDEVAIKNFNRQLNTMRREEKAEKEEDI